MTTVERMLMQIFHRRRWIEEQLRQQALSYGQSLALNVLADGGTPPPWVSDLVPDAAADCLGPRELYREQLISGILNPLPCACTPSVGCHLPFGQTVVKESGPQPNFVPGTRLSRIFSLDDRDKQISDAYIAVGQDGGESMDIDAVGTAQNQNPVVSNQQPSAWRNVEHLVGNSEQLADDTGKNIKSNSFTRNETGLTVAPMGLDYSESSQLNNAVVLSSGCCCKGEQLSKFTQKQIDVVESTSSAQQLLKQVEKNSPQKVPSNQTDFLNQKSVTIDGNHDTLGSRCAIKSNMSAKVRQIIYIGEEMDAQTVGILSETSIPNCTGCDNKPSEPRYLLRSSSTKKKEVESINPKSSPKCGYKVEESSKFTPKNLDFVKSPSKSAQQLNQVEEESLQNFSAWRINFSDQKCDARYENDVDSGTHCADKIKVSPEVLQIRDNTDIEDTQTAVMLSEMAIPNYTGSDGKSSKPCHFLRSSPAEGKELGSSNSKSSIECGYQVEESSKSSRKQLDCVESAPKSVQQVLNHVEEDNLQMVPVSQSNFSNQKNDAVANNAYSRSQFSMKSNVSPEVPHIRDNSDVEDAQTVGVPSETATADYTGSDSRPSKSRYFLRSSSTKGKEVYSTKPNLSPECGYKVEESSQLTNKQPDFVEPASNSACQPPKHVEEDCQQHMPGGQSYFSNHICDAGDGNSADSDTCYPMDIMVSLDVPQTGDISHTDDAETVVVPNSMESDRKVTKSQYSLRSSSITEKEIGSIKSNSSPAANCSSRLKKIDPCDYKATWPKMRKRVCQLDSNAIYGTPIKRLRRLESGARRRMMNSQNPSEAVVRYHPLGTSNVPASEFSNPAIGSSLGGMVQDDSLSFGATKDFQQRWESTTSSPRRRSLGDGEVLLHPKNISEHGILDASCYSEKILETKDDTNAHFRLGTSYGSFDPLLKNKVDIDVSRESMPEYERFSIGDSAMGGEIVSNNPDYLVSTNGQDSAKEELYTFRKTLTPLPNSSTKYKKHVLPDSYHSSPGRLFGQVNFSSFHLGSSNSDGNKMWEDGNFIEFFGGSELDGSLPGRPRSLGICATSFPFTYDARRPFTPPMKTPYQKVTSERTVGSSEPFSSNPELTCFRIDENVSMHEDELLQDELVAEETEASSEHLVTTSRKPLADKNSFHQIAPTMASTSEKFPDRGSLDSVSTEACFQFQARDIQMKGDTNGSSLKSNLNSKENLTSSAAGTKAYKPTKSVRNRSSKPKTSLKVKDQHKTNVATEKGNKPLNIVSNLSSFVPLLQQKQQAATIPNGKRDIKVKSLEAAGAAKRLEEKKERQRKMKKEAIRLERLRIEQENSKQLEVEQKLKEEAKRKKEAEIEARKRQREDDEKKERQQKRRCMEEMQHRRQLEDRVNAERKALRNKAPKELKKKEDRKEVLVWQNSIKEPDVAEFKKQPEINERKDGMDGQDKCKAICYSNGFKKEVQDGKFIVKERRESQSYELSPYRDSDDEDEEDNRQKRKIVPLWARRESVDRIVDFHKHTDPVDIFSRKKSCSLEEMLSVPTRVRILPFAPQ